MVEEEKTKKETKSEEIELLATVKEQGVGLRMPEGNVLDVSELSPALVEWMLWTTKTLNKISRNLV